MGDIGAVTRRAKQILREGRYRISVHALYDHPERAIGADDITACLADGHATALEPREVEGRIKYRGSDRYRWFGLDSRDRVLRLIIVVTENLVVVSAAEATERQAERYRAEREEEEK